MNANQIVQKILDGAGKYRLSQVKGMRTYTLDHLSKGKWIVGMRVNTNAAERAIKSLKTVAGEQFTFFLAP